jgi:hypothetical protein
MEPGAFCTGAATHTRQHVDVASGVTSRLRHGIHRGRDRIDPATSRAIRLLFGSNPSSSGCERRSSMATAYDTVTRYEFTTQQNELIGDLAGKMRLVGLVAMVLGVLNMLSAILLLVFVFQDRLPADILQRIPEDVRANLPPTAYLWGYLLQAAAAGLIFLMLGSWTRSAAASFQRIVDTTNRDIGHLMEALNSLRKMYSLLYSLIVITVIVFLVGLGIQLYHRFAA